MAGNVKEDLHIGGQAVFEGVMLKSNDNVATVVRNPKNKFVFLKQRLKRRKNLLRLPFVRGIVNLYDMLVLGTKTLIWSSNQVLDEKEKLTPKDIFFMLLTSIVLVICVFIIAPFFVTKIFVNKGVWFNLIDGVIKIAFFVAYIFLISLSSDVKTLFQYHGAEHKVVNCFEHGEKVNLKNAKKYTTVHRRCGTSFLMVVLLISIAVFSLIITNNILLQIVFRILLIPVIAALGYEFIRFGAKHSKNWFFRASTLPGEWLQKITTREPTDKQLEVSLKTFETLMLMEKKKS